MAELAKDVVESKTVKELIEKRKARKADGGAAKKPFYKKWWFWVIIVLLAICVAAAGSTEQEKNQDGSDNTDISAEAELEAGSPEWLEAKTKEVTGNDDFISVTYNPETEYALIKFRGSESYSNDATVKYMYHRMFDILKSIQDEVRGDIDFNVVYPMVDKYGNSEDQIVIKASFKNATIKKINFNGTIAENIPVMADEWWNHPNVKLSE